MRLLFEMDRKDYDRCTHVCVRHSARSIIIRDGRIAMVHSLLKGHYKLPGGGIEPGEKPVDAMIRETLEESGLVVRPETIRPYGFVHRIQKGSWDESECFIQDNYYYLCEADEEPAAQQLDEYEAREGYQLEFVEPQHAIAVNRRAAEEADSRMMHDRECRVLEMLMDEGYFA